MTSKTDTTHKEREKMLRDVLEMIRIRATYRWQAGDLPSEEMLAISATDHLREIMVLAENGLSILGATNV